jgi:MFS family permease
VRQPPDSQGRFSRQDTRRTLTATPLAGPLLIVLVGFFVVGLAMPVLPLYVHRTLGLSTLMVGLVAGAQFTTAFFSRPIAGRYADTRGAKRAVLLGLAGSTIAGVLYLAAVCAESRPTVSALILLAGRAVLGGAESFIITGTLAWSLSLAAPGQTGRVVAWLGMAMYVAFAVGAPLGTMLFEARGFVSIALATLGIPVACLAVVARLRGIPRAAAAQAPPIRQVLSAVTLPGIGLALSSFGFGSMIAFASILFAARHWSPVWPAFTGFAVAFVIARLVLGHLPDRLGGARVALVFIFVEASGQALLGFATNYEAALAGAVFTGVGYSLVYPSFAVEAVKRAPVQAKAFAMGTYTAFLDLSLGFGSPLLGCIAGVWGIESVFVCGALAVSTAAVVALKLRLDSRRSGPLAVASEIEEPADSAAA